MYLIKNLVYGENMTVISLLQGGLEPVREELSCDIYKPKINKKIVLLYFTMETFYRSI